MYMPTTPESRFASIQAYLSYDHAEIDKMLEDLACFEVANLHRKDITRVCEAVTLPTWRSSSRVPAPARPSTSLGAMVSLPNHRRLAIHFFLRWGPQRSG